MATVFSLAMTDAYGATTVIKPSAQLKLAPAKLRTPEDMERDAALEAAGLLAAPEQSVQVPFRPTMNEAQYRKLKTEASKGFAPAQSKPETLLAPQLLAAPVLKGANIEGVNRNEAGALGFMFDPPDTHGTVGRNHFVEVTNSHLDIYSRVSPFSRVKSVTLNTFFGYNVAGKYFFDPRAVYDRAWNRWVITCAAIPENAVGATQKQFYFVAFSQTDNPLGAFWVYKLQVTANVNEFWDYQQVGMDQDTIILTANFFVGNTSQGARLITLAKARVYNGLGTVVPLWTGLRGTLAPPIVLDQNPKTFLAAAAATNAISIYTLTNSSRGGGAVLSGPVTIPVPTWSFPPDAAQPGTGALLDSLDGRFVNAGTQVGNSLFQVHTIKFNATAFCIPKWYEFNTSTNTVIQSGIISRSGTSYDFNASIAANDSKDVFVTWTATDPAKSVNAEVRFSGRLHTDALGVIPAGSSLGGSSTFKGTATTSHPVLRWGDYSAVSLDPKNASRAWVVNEKNVNTSTWGSRIGEIGF